MKDISTLNSLLAIYIDNPENAEINFNLALWYHSKNQTAAAVSFYLRTAERTDNKLLIYESMLRAAMCFNTQGTRNNSVEGMLQHAVALLPKRPEAYFHLARFYEKTEKWQNAYLISSIGMQVAEKYPTERLITKIDYPGFWAIEFEKAVVSWWCGLCEESKNIFNRLIFNEPLDKTHKDAAIGNLKKLHFWPDETELNTFFRTKEEEINSSFYQLDLYFSKSHSSLRTKFPGSEIILRNYSETWQDIFVLTALGGKREGTFLEIGASYPIFANNTYLLESEFGWKGISLDNEKKFTQKHLLNRDNFSFSFDALAVDYIGLLSECGFSTQIDYLQIDCGDPLKSMSVLSRLVEAGISFKVLTFSHDHYQSVDSGVKEKSRKLLTKAGYTLFLSNVSHNQENDYEDWWIDSSSVSEEFFKDFKNTDNSVKMASKIFLR